MSCAGNGPGDMRADIRDRSSIRHEDVLALNFIRAPGAFVYRRHFRQGLRSHIMEILPRTAVAAENEGIVIDGIRRFPRAKPVYMLRIFRTRLATLQDALDEIARVEVVARYLGPDFAAASSEFVVDYHGPRGPAIMLCGLQAYVPGEIVDPWNLLDAAQFLPSLHDRLHGAGQSSPGQRRSWIAAARRKARRFVAAVKQMIAEERQIPDLAGAGNLVLRASGDITLVDINNISPVVFDDAVPLDDKGYPVCDKSVEALSLIEAKLLGRAIDRAEPAYRFFLDPARKRRAAAEEAAFYQPGDTP